VIGLDTNILVRYIVQDDPAQSRVATDLIEKQLSESDPGFVPIIAMVEIVWVLERSYGFSDADIATAIERMLQIETLLVEDEQDVFTAMIALADGRGTFADALIGARSTRAGCTRILTFDRKALRLPGFESP
jgi:predicted nucleic-acid-binding protein